MRKPDPFARWVLCNRFPGGFRYFLPLWRFKNRETGQVLRFDDLWEGQARLVQAMLDHPWLFALKAGKLGFTELECAWDAYSLLFRIPNARVQLISKLDEDSKNLHDWVRFGLEGLPEEWGLYIPKGKARSDTANSLRLKSNMILPWNGQRWMAEEDERILVSLTATQNVAISDTAIHTHLDELSHMQFAKQVWNSVETTVAPEIGSMHIVTRGHGDGVYSAELWEAAKQPGSKIHPFFARWDERPRPEGYREQQAVHMTPQGLAYFLPETEQDALMGEDDSPYIPLEVWNALEDPRFKDGGQWELVPGDRTPIVLALDAGISNDTFGIVAVSRHPERKHDVAVRKAKLWRPSDFPNKRIDIDTAIDWVRWICKGGCPLGHPVPFRDESVDSRACEFCRARDFSVPGHNVVQITYDPYQLESPVQRLRRNRVAWCDSFDQGGERLIADAGLFRLAMSGRLAHDGNPDVAEHIGNARAKITSAEEEESKMRIIKKSMDRKVDLAVAISMAAHRCLYLNI